MKPLKLLLLLTALAIAVAGCGGEETTVPTVAPTVEPVEESTEAAAEESAVAEEPTPTFESAAVPEGTTPLDTMEFQVDPDLIDVTWEWFQRTTTEGTEVLLEVPNPKNYTLFFNADQTFSALLDCNNGAGEYVTDGNGNIFMHLGPMTAAECPPESLSDAMVTMFGPAQSYVYEDDGNTVIFKFAAGGPWDYYRKADGSSAGDAGAAETATAGDSLAGTTWTLTELNGQPLLPTTEITAQFNDDGTVGGSSGCNNYNAAYEADGTNINIQASPAAMTLMACPELVMEQETAYLAALDAAETFEINGDELVLYDADGNPVAQFSAVSQDLAGTSWDVISYNNGRGGVTSLIIGTEITADFGEDGQLTGNAGCNDYFGPYEAVEGDISMGPFGTTRKVCPEPEGVMEQEAEYLAALETAATYTVDGMTMNMRTADGATVANFRRKLPIADLIITPSDISLSTGPLDTTWQAFIVPRTPYDESQPPGPMGLPIHIEILFGDGADPAAHELGQPIMYIIPVNTYRKLWNDAGNEAVTRTIQEIQELNFVLVSPAPTSGYPALPYEEIGAGANDLAVQVGRAVSQAELNTVSATQDGYRFVGRWVQDPNPVTNEGLRYVYQGFTNDGVYLVSFWWPESTPLLANDVSEVPAEEMEAFNGDYSAYMDATAEALNATSSEEWDPDIALLDAIVASLEIAGMTPSGLLDTTWQWTRGQAQPGSSEIVEVPDPSKYEVTYGSDGTMTFTADCNSGSMTFELNNAGMTGGMLAQP
ncbi:MAG: META domain-containing protein, partial [Chloroflexota bacterium]